MPYLVGESWTLKFNCLPTPAAQAKYFVRLLVLGARRKIRVQYNLKKHVVYKNLLEVI